MKDWPWYGYVVAAFVVFIIFFFLYFKPKNDELKNLKTERINLESEILNLKRKKKQLDQIEIELKQLDASLAELEAIIPKEKETDIILTRIQQLAYDSRLEIEKFVPKSLINVEFYNEWPISMQIRGNYSNLATFFERLSNFSRLFGIDNFTIKVLRNQTDALTLTANSTAKTYIYLEAPPPTKKKPKRKGKR